MRLLMLLQAVEVLKLVVSNGTRGLEAADMARLLQVSSSLRLALQQGGGSFSIALGTRDSRYRGATAYMEKVANMFAWLPKHSRLVSSILVHLPQDNEIATNLAQFSIALLAAQVAAAAPAEAAAGSGLVDAPIAQLPWRHAWGLPECAATERLLTAVASMGVTKLECRMAPASTEAIAALGKL